MKLKGPLFHTWTHGTFNLHASLLNDSTALPIRKICSRSQIKIGRHCRIVTRLGYDREREDDFEILTCSWLEGWSESNNTGGSTGRRLLLK